MADEHLQHLMQLIEAKQVYTSFALLKKMPADTYVPGKQRILDELKEALTRGKAIHAILQNSRNNGDYPTALTQGLKLLKIVPDYPNLKQDIKAIQIALKKLTATISEAKIAANHGRTKEVIQLLQTIRQIHAEHDEIKPIERTVRRRAREKSAKTIVISTLIIVIPCILFGFEKIMLWRAHENLTTAGHLIKAHQFKQAKKSIAKMQTNLNFIYVFNTVDKEDLTARAVGLQASTAFIQGIRGRVVHEGEYINKKKKDIIIKLEKICIEAAKLTENNSLQESIDKYSEALLFVQTHAKEVGSAQQDLLAKIDELEQRQEATTKQLNTDECLTAINLAQTAYIEENWLVATENYASAFTLATDLPDNEACVKPQSISNYNTSVLTIMTEKGDAHRDNHDSSAAISSYEQAISYATEKDMPETTILAIQTRIDGLMEQAFLKRVHHLILEGDGLIKQEEFKAGLSKYNFGLTMLEGNTELIQGKDKLISHLTEKINTTEKYLATVAQTTYLQTTAEADIRRYFDLARQDTLEQFAIALTKHEENLYTYKVSAKSVREKIKYELLYQFNENTNTWKMIK